MKTKPHHRGTHQVRARRLVAAAKADPTTKCWRCGLTLAEHRLHKNGKPAFWTAGHLVDGEIDGVLMPEASRCNYEAGAAAGNRRRRQPRNPTSRKW
ncbi:MAG: hypothetical protein WKF58_04925 [Ilumatobacteraceae bacterium]